jgi:hypothetical protein
MKEMFLQKTSSKGPGFKKGKYLSQNGLGNISIKSSVTSVEDQYEGSSFAT